MRKTLMTLTAMAGLIGAGLATAAHAAPASFDGAAVRTVQYYLPAVPYYGVPVQYYGDRDGWRDHDGWREREWHRRQEWMRWQEHERHERWEHRDWR